MTTRASALPPQRRHLLHVFPTFAVGGAQRRFGELGRLLADRYRHTIISLDGNVEMAARLSGQFEFQVVGARFEKSRGLANIPSFRRTLRQLAPDMLVTYNWGSIEWALADRCAPIARHVHIEDGFGPEESSRQLARRIWTRRIALSGSHTRIVVPSYGLADIARNTWRLAPSSVVHIPNGVDCERFAPRGEKRVGANVVVGTIAALRREKNIRRLIDAFAETALHAPNLRLVVAGDGPERDELQAHSRPFAHLIDFPGATTSPEITLAEFDIFAITSDTEQMPFSLLEAMAAGLPVAAVDVGDVAVMVAAENRLFVTPRADHAGLERSLKNLAFDDALRERLGRANREKALSTYDINLMAARYRQLFG